MKVSFDELREARKARKKLVNGLLELLILTTLRQKETSGYGLISQIHRTFEVLLSPGSLYPMLISLEKMGLIEGKKSDGKKLYKLTSEGESLCHLLYLDYMKVTSKATSMIEANQERAKRIKSEEG